MRNRIALAIVGALTLILVGCGTTDKTITDTNVTSQSEETIPTEEELEAQRIEEERKAEEERLEAERKAEEERLAEEKRIEEERISNLRAEVESIITDTVPTLIEEMTENHNENGINVLNEIVDTYTDNVDDFMTQYNAFLETKSEYDTEWEKFPFIVTDIEEKQMYTNGSANIRNLPTETDSEVYETYGINTKITVNGECDNWYRIVYNDTVAYISKSLTSDTETYVAPPTPSVREVDASNYTVGSWLYDEYGFCYAFFILNISDYINNYSGFADEHKALNGTCPTPNGTYCSLYAKTTDGRYMYVTYEMRANETNTGVYNPTWCADGKSREVIP